MAVKLYVHLLPVLRSSSELSGGEDARMAPGGWPGGSSGKTRSTGIEHSHTCLSAVDGYSTRGAYCYLTGHGAATSLHR